MAQIFMLALSSSMARKEAQLIPKSKCHERDNVIRSYPSFPYVVKNTF